MTPKQRLTLARVLALIAVIAISVYVYSIRDQASSLQKYGFPGIFLLSILANGTVLLPAPGIVLVFAWGSVFNPLGVGLAAGAGAALGELTGYMAGFGGQAVVERADLYHRLVDWMQNNQRISYLAILLLAFVPNPFFDLAGMAAGTLKMPISRFFLWCFIGKTCKMLLIAYLGASAIAILH